MRILRPLPSCTWNPVCTCGALKVVREQLEEDHVIRFIEALTDIFEHFESQVLLMTHLPSILTVFSVATKHERQQSQHAFTLHQEGNNQMLINQTHFINTYEGDVWFNQYITTHKDSFRSRIFQIKGNNSFAHRLVMWPRKAKFLTLCISIILENLVDQNKK